jgi:catalase
MLQLCMLATLWGSTQGAAAQVVVSDGMPERLVGAFDTLFGGSRPGIRAVHSNGLVVLGDFMPSSEAASLSRAAHLNGGPVPVVVRFSNFAGAAALPDTAPEASPRGMAIRFLLPDGSDTDIVAHSYNGFPAGTPDGFLDFLRAAATPDTLPAFAATRPAVQAFLAAPKPTPASYGTETYFGVNAFRFTNAEGTMRHGRYRMVPLAGERHLTPAETATEPPDFLASELAGRLAGGPVAFHLLVQLAAPGDAVDDGSVPWPLDRPTVDLGILRLRTLAACQTEAQQRLHFTPTNLVGGIAASRDPMLLARTEAYRVSSERRGGGEP